MHGESGRWGEALGRGERKGGGPGQGREARRVVGASPEGPRLDPAVWLCLVCLPGAHIAETCTGPGGRDGPPLAMVQRSFVRGPHLLTQFPLRRGSMPLGQPLHFSGPPLQVMVVYHHTCPSSVPWSSWGSKGRLQGTWQMFMEFVPPGPGPCAGQGGSRSACPGSPAPGHSHLESPASPTILL